MESRNKAEYFTYSITLIKYGDKKGENHIKYREKIVGEKAKIQN